MPALFERIQLRSYGANCFGQPVFQPNRRAPSYFVVQAVTRRKQQMGIVNIGPGHLNSQRNTVGLVAVVGEVAYTWAQDALTLSAHTGAETLQFAGHRITLYRKQSDGRWLLARDAHTLSPVPKKTS